MTEDISFVVGTDEIDLLDGGDGYRLRLDGWVPQIAQRSGDGYDDVVETITLKAVGSNISNLASIITDDIEDRIEWINERISDPVAPDLLFLRWRMPGQLNRRQALVRELSYSMGNSPYFPPVLNQKTFPSLTLSIERLPFWEDTFHSIATAYSVLSGGESKFLAQSQTPRGTAPGRIKRLLVTGGTNLAEYWLGFRSSKYGNRDHFQPVWPFDTVTTDNDATASGGTVTWNSADSDLLERLRISMDQVSSIPATQYRSQRGTFAVLLRARSTGTETFNVQLSDGFYTDGTDNKNTHSRVKVSGTSFLFYPLGNVTIPPMQLRETSHDSSVLGNYHLRLAAEVNTAGTGNFEATRFVLIPQDEGFLHIKGVNTSTVASPKIETSADGRISAFTLLGTTDAVQMPTELDLHKFAFPRTACNVVLAGHGTSQDLTGVVNIEIAYHARWLGLGGT
jgi:hypothetical protein